MIIWINGAFGSGKSQTAYELHRRIPQSFVYDPEKLGFFIAKNMPESLKEADFQHYPMWREGNYAMLSYISGRCDGIVIVPMTVADPRYFEEIVGRLRSEGADLRHFTLCASKETLLKRLRTRGEGPRSWAALQIDRCLEGLSDPCFRHHLDTENMTIGEVAETIASLASVELKPDRRSKAGKIRDRILTQIKQIRFFD